MKRFIIDFEFTWLDNSLKSDNEIISMSILDIDNPEKKNCYIFSSDTKNTIGSYLINRITPEDQEWKPKFSWEIFFNILQEYWVNKWEELELYWFWISTDLDMLRRYNILIWYHFKWMYESRFAEDPFTYIDLQSQMRLSVDSEYNRIYEEDMIINWCGLEVCYQLVTGKEFIGTHVCTDEVEAILDIYNIVSKQDKSDYLSYVPFGYMKGQTIQHVIMYNRSSVDWYRFNNDDLLSETYNDYIDYHYEEDEDYEDY